MTRSSSHNAEGASPRSARQRDGAQAIHRAIAHPVLERLAEATGDTAYLNARSGADALCLNVCEGRCPTKALPMSVGNRRPLGVGAAALAVLGALPAAEAALVMQRNTDRYRWPGLTPDKVEAALRELQSCGHIVTTGRLGGRYRGVAVPVTDRQGRFALALSISATAERLDAARVAQVVVTLGREAREFAQAL